MLTIAALFFAAAAASAPIEANLHGILGVSVGMPVAEVRQRLASFGTIDSRSTGEGGVKAVCRAERSGFLWIAYKADARGRVVWVTGHRRPGLEIPFDRLASSRPDTDTATIAIWHTEGVRLTARGRERRAQVLTLMAEQ